LGYALCSGCVYADCAETGAEVAPWPPKGGTGKQKVMPGTL